MDYYGLLKLPKTASSSQIKKSYKKLALQYHPDKNPTKKQEAKEKFTKISEAYAVLSNPKKRQDYDRSLQNKNNFGQEQYKWKNPEFDPSYDHFPEGKNQSQNSRLQHFANLDGFLRFPILKTNYLNVPFGEFTFEMAEQIFNSVYSEIQKNPEIEGLMSIKPLMSQRPFSSSQIVDSNPNGSSYKPKNSLIVSQKIVERNGQKVLIKKYSITENGFTRTETHESIIH